MSIDPNVTRSYSVTPDQMADFRSELATNKIIFPEGNNGVIKTNGITISFEYDGTSKLNLTILSKPFLIPSGMVWDKLEAYVQ